MIFGFFHCEMIRHLQRARFATVAVAATTMIAGLSGCIAHRGEPGSIDRTFAVSGPVHLELTNPGGDSKVSVGAAGQVLIHADFQAKSWSEHGANQRTAEMTTNPPFSQGRKSYSRRRLWVAHHWSDHQLLDYRAARH